MLRQDDSAANAAIAEPTTWAKAILGGVFHQKLRPSLVAIATFGTMILPPPWIRNCLC